MDRLIGLLAALVGLIALGAAVIVDVRNEDSARRIASDMAEMKVSLSLLNQRSSVPQHDGVPEGLLALQTRLAALEKAAKEAPAAIPAAASPAADQGGVGVTDAPPAGITASTTGAGPSSNCIPLNTRFMVETGQSYAICHRAEVVKVADIQPDLVLLEGGNSIAAGGFGKLGFSDCSVMVFSADLTGFAEMRVSCTK